MKGKFSYQLLFMIFVAIFAAETTVFAFSDLPSNENVSQETAVVKKTDNAILVLEEISGYSAGPVWVEKISTHDSSGNVVGSTPVFNARQHALHTIAFESSDHSKLRFQQLFPFHFFW